MEQDWHSHQASEHEAQPRALVVDDEASLNDLLVELLGDDGYQTLSARDGEEALRLITRCAPDVVVLDMMMPGMGGVEVARALKSDPCTAHIPLLALSSTLEAITAADRHLFAARLAKPFDVDTLLLTLRRAITPVQ